LRSIVLSIDLKKIKRQEAGGKDSPLPKTRVKTATCNRLSCRSSHCKTKRREAEGKDGQSQKKGKGRPLAIDRLPDRSFDRSLGRSASKTTQNNQRKPCVSCRIDRWVDWQCCWPSVTPFFVPRGKGRRREGKGAVDRPTAPKKRSLGCCWPRVSPFFGAKRKRAQEGEKRSDGTADCSKK